MESTTLLDGLDAQQRAAVTTPGQPLCILAGAGSGKTRVLTRRVAHRIAGGDADPRHTLVLTFTRKAAGELGARLGALGVRDRVAAGTFHAVAYAQLRHRWADAGSPAPRLLERKARLVAKLLGARTERAAQPADVVAEIEWAKARMVSPAHYPAAVAQAGRRPPMAAASVAALYERYEEEKRRQRLVDFDDLLLLCLHAIEGEGEFAAAQHWRFRHLFVDEFQDVNPLQHRLLEAWRAGRPDLCVVGDPDQAIYGWNGADPGFLDEFCEHHPGAEVVRLERNYRSTPQVVEVANRVLAAGRVRPRRLTAVRPDGAEPIVRSFPTDLDEARGVARSLRDAHGPGVAWSHLAVLARTHGQLALVEEALREAHIPYRLRGGSPFLEQSDVRDALRELQRGAGSFSAGLADLAERVADVSAAATEPEGPAAARLGNLETLLRLAHDYGAVDPAPSVDGYLEWLSATVRSDEPDRGGDSVELATFHASKGLEWPVVFVTGLEQGFVPIAHAVAPAARDEEQRLLYVAVTRAERALHCSWTEQRTFGERTVRRAPSPWIDDIRAAIGAAGTAPDDWRPALARQRERLRLVAPSARRKGPSRDRPAPDPGVLAALQAWRSAAARAAGVPAHLVFGDTTLAALAERRPRAADDLLAVPGIGPVKAARYGDALLAVVAKHSA